MRNVGMVVFHHDTGVMEEQDDWYADCTITYKNEKLYAGPVVVLHEGIWEPLAHPATFREASDAVDEFRTKRAREIVKEYKNGKTKQEEK